MFHKGRIPDAFLLHNKIACLEGTPSRENLTLCRQPSILITHAETRRRFRELHDPIVIALQEQEALAAKQLVSDQRSLKKRI